MKIRKILSLLLLSVIITFSLTSCMIPIQNNYYEEEDESLKFDNYNLIIGANLVTTYYVNDTFKVPSIYAKYSDNNIVEVTYSDKLSITGYDLSKSGVQVVTLEYIDGNFKGVYSYRIYVYSSKIKSISVSYPDTDIYWGEQLDRNKLKVTVYYTNNTNRLIDDYTLKYNSHPDSYGLNIAYITYQNVSTSFNINVIEKKINDEYSNLEQEGKMIITKLGKENPTCPKDYTFEKDTSGNGTIRSTGTLYYTEETIEQLYAFLYYYVFNGYSLIDGPTETYEAIFPSIKVVFKNNTNNMTATMYLMQSGNNIQYMLLIK